MTDISQKQGGWTPGPWRTNGCYISSNYGEVGHAYYVSGMPEWMSEANARLLASAPCAMALVDRVAALNPDAGEIGAGMLVQLVTEARRIQARANPSTDQGEG